jgi:hypothetical protein
MLDSQLSAAYFYKVEYVTPNDDLKISLVCGNIYIQLSRLYPLSLPEQNLDTVLTAITHNNFCFAIARQRVTGISDIESMEGGGGFKVSESIFVDSNFPTFLGKSPLSNDHKLRINTINI